MNTPSKLLVRLVTAAFVGAVLFSLFVMYGSSQAALSQLQGMRRVLSTANVFTYGTVQSVDIQGDEITISVPSRFGIADPPLLLNIKISKFTYIAHQELQQHSGMYDELSEQTPASLSDISVGDRVAVLADHGNNAITASVLLFGLPL